MISAPESIASALRDLKSKTSDEAYLLEMTRLADLDPQSDAFATAERVFALRERIAKLQRRMKELEAHK